MSLDEKTKPSSKKALLGELESIKDLLLEQEQDLSESFSDETFDDLAGLDDGDFHDDGLDIDIPILEDVVDENTKSNHQTAINQATLHNEIQQPLLDLNAIFEDPVFEPATAPIAAEPVVSKPITSESITSESIVTKPIASKPSELIASKQANHAPSPQVHDSLTELDLGTFDTNIEIPKFSLSANHSDETAAETAAEQSKADEPSEEEELLFNDDPINDRLESEINPAEIIVADKPIEMDLLIQEIVDEFIPQIEDELRQRLSQCSPTTLQQLAEKHLKP